MKKLLTALISVLLISCTSVNAPKNSWKYETDEISMDQFQTLLAETKSIKNAELKEDKNFINVTIDPTKSESGELVVFIFTKPGNPNHPAAARVIKSKSTPNADPKIEFHRVGDNPQFKYFVRTITIDAMLRL